MAQGRGAKRTKQQEADDLHARMFYAIENNDTEVLQNLLKLGMDANTVYTGSDSMGRPLHWSPLHLCCEKGRENCVRLLLKYGANTEEQDKWCQTPLMYAVKTEWRNLVALLIEAGAELDAQEQHGSTALHLAVDCSDDK